MWSTTRLCLRTSFLIYVDDISQIPLRYCPLYYWQMILIYS